MKCPTCGYNRQAKDNEFVPENECPSCGLIYENNAEGLEQPSSPIRKPSPVSASSLRKARERVDKRLHERQKAQFQDSRHNQTLELARRLTAEGVQKRREEWKKQQNAESVETKNQPQASEEPSLELETPADESKAEVNRSAKTIAKALKKQQKEPQRHKDTALEVADQQKTAHKNADAPEPNNTDSEQSEHAMNKTPDEGPKPADEVSAATVSRKPIQLFQNKPVASDSGNGRPPSLKEMLKDYDPPQPEKEVKEHRPRTKKERRKYSLTQLLPVVAWLILGAGVFGAILSWTTIGDVEAGMRNAAMARPNSLPLGLLLGFAYLATGVLGFAFFWVSSLISRQLKDIRRLLLLQPSSNIETQEDPKI